MMAEKILQQGAEALIIQKDGLVTKRRIKKSYRLPSIDEKIRKQRTRAEGKLLGKAGKIINIPKVIRVDEKTKEIVMKFIDGLKLSDDLNKLSLHKQKHIMQVIGFNIAALHDAGIIHGDLTTSNMILVKKTNEKDVNNKESKSGSTIKNIALDRAGENNDMNFKIFFIDFGLGFHSNKAEDKAVDIHLLRQALEAKHFRYWQTLFDEFLKGYSVSKHDSLVKNQFRKVEARGRYKDRY